MRRLAAAHPDTVDAVFRKILRQRDFTWAEDGPLAISVAGRTGVLPIVGQPFTSPQLLIPLPSKNQALQLQRTLASSG